MPIAAFHSPDRSSWKSATHNQISRWWTRWHITELYVWNRSYILRATIWYRQFYFVWQHTTYTTYHTIQRVGMYYLFRRKSWIFLQREGWRRAPPVLPTFGVLWGGMTKIVNSRLRYCIGVTTDLNALIWFHCTALNWCNNKPFLTNLNLNLTALCYLNRKNRFLINTCVNASNNCFVASTYTSW